MPSLRLSQGYKDLPHYVTLTVLHWYHIFDRHNRWQILADSLQYCMNNKELKLYGFVFMLNHIHLIIQSPDLIAILRDYKKFTSKRLKESFELHEPRVLELFLYEGVYHFWHKTNMPLLVESEKFFNQKLEYIHMNPVRKQYVMFREQWFWSSANPHCPLKCNARAV